MDDSGTLEAVRSSRLRILAVRILGYTHTEYGLRPMRRIVEELQEAMPDKQTTNAEDDGAWIDEEVI